MCSRSPSNLNHEIVRAGFAWWYRQYARHDKELERLESEAKGAKRGLWVDKIRCRRGNSVVCASRDGPLSAPLLRRHICFSFLLPESPPPRHAWPLRSRCRLGADPGMTGRSTGAPPAARFLSRFREVCWKLSMSDRWRCSPRNTQPFKIPRHQL